MVEETRSHGQFALMSDGGSVRFIEPQGRPVILHVDPEDESPRAFAGTPL